MLLLISLVQIRFSQNESIIFLETLKLKDNFHKYRFESLFFYRNLVVFYNYFWCFLASVIRNSHQLTIEANILPQPLPRQLTKISQTPCNVMYVPQRIIYISRIFIA